jgi:hypothetical protein
MKKDAHWKFLAYGALTDIKLNILNPRKSKHCMAEAL